MIDKTVHLTEDELDDLLIGAGSLACAEHAAGCVLCRERMVAFESAVGNFNQATMAWAEAKSNTIPRELVAEKPAAWFRRPAAIWPAGSAALLALAVGLNTHHFGSATTPTIAAVAPTAPGEIASDNAMLAEIDSALYAPVASPIDSFAAASVVNARRKHNSALQVKN